MTTIACINDGRGFDVTGTEASTGFGIVRKQRLAKPLRSRLNLRSAERDGAQVELSLAVSLFDSLKQRIGSLKAFLSASRHWIMVKLRLGFALWLVTADLG